MMQYVELPGVDASVSRVVQGAISLFALDEETRLEMLDAAVEGGITAFDTAVNYAFGDISVDAMLGRWISHRGGCEDIVVIAKGCHPDISDWGSRVNPDAIVEDIDKSRQQIGIDRLDLWMFHRDDPDVEIGILVEAVNAAIDRGHIGAWGVSNWTTARIGAALDYAATHDLRGPVANSAHYSLADQLDDPWPDVVTLTGPEREADRQWHRQRDVAVVAWSSLAGGFLSERISRAELEAAEGFIADTARCYLNDDNWARRERAAEVGRRLGLSLSQVALAWALHADFNPLVIVANATVEEVDENIAAEGTVLADADLDYIFSG
ncbi:MAG: aldo/keto reductase [Acidimicrobiia bacterium]|nr:aldo/keto reductase [Acidimicrobiia bacterium]MYG59755.1 aldo/keto reductase [Acidimicrobiia bacterium]MYH96778.1 aldo/keto reductase [Acidimicrobiia bacterium]MYJ34192.1 aldo/keto reductase [Acidimicrobiia bacterium]MYL09199.1 aldo/keto reductase [Acidimicrobiia bacterium]